MFDKKVQIYYEKTYSDDIGRKTNDVFSKNLPEFLAYRKMWSGVIDGFIICSNSDLQFFCTEGNMRIVIVAGDDVNPSFSQYFMSELDGKVVTVEKDTKFAIQNIDENKSSYIMGSFEEELDIKHLPKNIFDWKRKLA